MKTYKWIKEILCLVLSVAIVVSASFCISRKLMPIRYGYGSTWYRYLEEEENSIDTLFVGSSVLYASLNPVVYEETTGETAYVLAGPELSIPLAYYYIKEALKTQSPSNIYLEMTTYFNQYSEFNPIVLGYMPLSENRVEAALFAVPKDEILTELNPLYLMHQELTSFGALTLPRDDETKDEQRGFVYLEGQEGKLIERIQRSYEYNRKDLKLVEKYLRKIQTLCDKEGISLVMYLTPERVYPNENDINNIKEMLPGVKLIDFNEYYDEFGFLDWEWYDNLHLNGSGAYKFSLKFSEYAKDR